MPVVDPSPEEAFDFVAVGNQSSPSLYDVRLKPLSKEQIKRWQVPLNPLGAYDFTNICPYCLEMVAKDQGVPKEVFPCQHGAHVHERCRQEKMATEELEASPPCPLCCSFASEYGEEAGGWVSWWDWWGKCVNTTTSKSK